MTSPSKSNILDYIFIQTGVIMIPHSFNGAPNQTGALYLTKNGTLQLNFAVNAENAPTWKVLLNQFDQLTRVNPHILSVTNYGITTLFKFPDPGPARALYNVVEVLQSDVKIVYKTEIPQKRSYKIDFEVIEMKNLKEMKENKEPVKAPAAVPKVVKAKLKKEKSLKNSFRTIVNAAKRINSIKEKPKIAKLPSNEEEETSPLLI